MISFDGTNEAQTTVEALGCPRSILPANMDVPGPNFLKRYK